MSWCYPARRFVSALLIVLAVTSFLSVSYAAAASDPCDMRADVNLDSVVTLDDVQIAVDAWRTTDMTYDINGDGLNNVIDVMLVVSDLGKRPCEQGQFGIAMANEFADSSMRAVVVDAGARWTRTAIHWADLEPSNADVSAPNFPGWSWSDQYLKAAMEQGLTPIVILWDTPTWVADTSMPSDFRHCGPFRDTVTTMGEGTLATTGLDEFAEFAGAFAERYDGDRDLDGDGVDDIPPDQDPPPNIQYVELYNEPEYDYNYSSLQANDEGGCWGHDGGAEKYAEMLRRAYLAMTPANPDVQIVLGTLAYERFTPNTKPAFIVDGGTGPFRYDFMDRVLEHLSNNYGDEPGFPFFHAVSFHDYNDFRNNWDGWSPDGTRQTGPINAELIGKANHLRAQKLKPYGLQELPVICSECSLASGPADSWTDRSEALQSLYPARMLARGLAGGLHAVVWHTLVDPGWYDFGLLRADHTQKPAYHAYQVATQYLTDAVFEKLLPASGADGTGSSDIEAYRFTQSDGSKLIVLWTDTGERLGKKSTPSITRDMTFTSAHFGGTWTGKLRVVQHDGSTSDVTGDSSITLTIDQAPQFVYVIP